MIELKDVLAYFHLITNTKDDVSFERIINVPRRGIGESTINQIKLEARNAGISMYDYILNVESENSDIPKKAINSLKTMITVISNTREAIKTNEEVFSKTLEKMILDFGYMEYLMKEDDGDERIENVKALFSDVRHFLQSNPESTFDEYLQNISLLSAQDEMIQGDHVTLMTVHTAKGLEYPVVFVVRFNQGVFPNNRALTEGGYLALEEERRLAYVAMTRAKEKLYLTFSNDYSYVIGGSLTPSTFIAESGNTVIRESSYSLGGVSNRVGQTIKTKPTFSDGPHLSFDEKETKNGPIKQNFAEKTNGLNESDWHVGDVVNHKTLGKGIVLELEGDNIIKVKFDEHGVKSIMCNHPFVSKGE